MAWLGVHYWLLGLGLVIGVFCLVMERMAYYRGIGEGIDRVRRDREAFERTHQIARESWDRLAASTPQKQPPQEMNFSGQTGYEVMAIKDAEGKPVVRVVFRIPAHGPGQGPSESGPECLITFSIGADEAQDMADNLRTAAGHADKACDKRPTSWARLGDDDPV